MGHSPWGHRELDTTIVTLHTCMNLGRAKIYSLSHFQICNATLVAIVLLCVTFSGLFFFNFFLYLWLYQVFIAACRLLSSLDLWVWLPCGMWELVQPRSIGRWTLNHRGSPEVCTSSPISPTLNPLPLAATKSVSMRLGFLLVCFVV